MFWVGRGRIYTRDPHRQWNLFMVIAAGAWHRMLLIITRLGADPTWPFSLQNLHQPCTNCYEVDMRIIVCNYPGTDTQHPLYTDLFLLKINSGRQNLNCFEPKFIEVRHYDEFLAHSWKYFVLFCHWLILMTLVNEMTERPAKKTFT